MTSIATSRGDDPPDGRSTRIKRKASPDAPDDPFSSDHDHKHPGMIQNAVHRQKIEPRRTNRHKRARHATTSTTSDAAIGFFNNGPLPPIDGSHPLQDISPFDMPPSDINNPVDTTIPSSPPRFVIKPPRRLDRSVNNGVEQPTSPTLRHLVIPPHHHSSEDGDDEDDDEDDKNVRVAAAAASPPTLSLPAVPISQAHPTSLSASHYHYRQPMTAASVSSVAASSSSSSSPDPLVAPNPYKPVAHTPSSAHAEEMAQRGRSRDWKDGRNGREDNDDVQRSSPLLSRTAFVVGLRRPEVVAATVEKKEEEEEVVGHNGESGERKEEVVWWKGAERRSRISVSSWREKWTGRR